MLAFSFYCLAGHAALRPHLRLLPLLQEIYVNAAVSHRNCVRLYGVCPEPAALITGETPPARATGLAARLPHVPLYWKRGRSCCFCRSCVPAAKEEDERAHTLHAQPWCPPPPPLQSIASWGPWR